MTQPEPDDQATEETQRRERIRQLVEEGREAELDEDEYQYAIENGLIEG